jgi:hypothetical protein
VFSDSLGRRTVFCPARAWLQAITAVPQLTLPGSLWYSKPGLILGDRDITINADEADHLL